MTPGVLDQGESPHLGDVDVQYQAGVAAGTQVCSGSATTAAPAPLPPPPP